jgi:hypothetical protein
MPGINKKAPAAGQTRRLVQITYGGMVLQFLRKSASEGGTATVQSGLTHDGQLVYDNEGMAALAVVKNSLQTSDVDRKRFSPLVARMDDWAAKGKMTARTLIEAEEADGSAQHEVSVLDLSGLAFDEMESIVKAICEMQGVEAEGLWCGFNGAGDVYTVAGNAPITEQRKRWIDSRRLAMDPLEKKVAACLDEDYDINTGVSNNRKRKAKITRNKQGEVEACNVDSTIEPSANYRLKSLDQVHSHLTAQVDHLGRIFKGDKVHSRLQTSNMGHRFVDKFLHMTLGYVSRRADPAKKGTIERLGDRLHKKWYGESTGVDTIERAEKRKRDVIESAAPSDPRGKKRAVDKVLKSRLNVNSLLDTHARRGIDPDRRCCRAIFMAQMEDEYLSVKKGFRVKLTNEYNNDAIDPPTNNATKREVFFIARYQDAEKTRPSASYKMPASETEQLALLTRLYVAQHFPHPGDRSDLQQQEIDGLDFNNGRYYQFVMLNAGQALRDKHWGEGAITFQGAAAAATKDEFEDFLNAKPENKEDRARRMCYISAYKLDEMRADFDWELQRHVVKAAGVAHREDYQEMLQSFADRHQAAGALEQECARFTSAIKAYDLARKSPADFLSVTHSDVDSTNGATGQILTAAKLTECQEKALESILLEEYDEAHDWVNADGSIDVAKALTNADILARIAGAQTHLVAALKNNYQEYQNTRALAHEHPAPTSKDIYDTWIRTSLEPFLKGYYKGLEKNLQAARRNYSASHGEEKEMIGSLQEFQTNLMHSREEQFDLTNKSDKDFRAWVSRELADKAHEKQKRYNLEKFNGDQEAMLACQHEMARQLTQMSVSTESPVEMFQHIMRELDKFNMHFQHHSSDQYDWMGCVFKAILMLILQMLIAFMTGKFYTHDADLLGNPRKQGDQDVSDVNFRLSLANTGKKFLKIMEALLQTSVQVELDENNQVKSATLDLDEEGMKSLPPGRKMHLAYLAMKEYGYGNDGRNSKLKIIGLTPRQLTQVKVKYEQDCKGTAKVVSRMQGDRADTKAAYQRREVHGNSGERPAKKPRQDDNSDMLNNLKNMGG